MLPREQPPQAAAPLYRHGSITSIGGRGGISRLPVHHPGFAHNTPQSTLLESQTVSNFVLYNYIVSGIWLRGRSRVTGMAGRSISSQGARLHHNSESEP